MDLILHCQNCLVRDFNLKEQIKKFDGYESDNIYFKVSKIKEVS